jgi:hypothetical protein
MPHGYVSTASDDDPPEAGAFAVLVLDPADHGQHATLNLGTLTLPEQVAYLKRLSQAAQSLAVQVSGMDAQVAT